MLASSMISSQPPCSTGEGPRAKRKRSVDAPSSLDGGMSPSSMDELPCKKSKATDETHFKPSEDHDPRECSDAPLHEDTIRDPTTAQLSTPPEDGECTDLDNSDSPLHAPESNRPVDSPRSDVGSPPRATQGDCYDAYYDGPGYDDFADDADRRRRTLKLQYWTRSDECKERKWDHLDLLDSEEHGMTREEHIYATTLAGRTSFMEPNMFPYSTPEGIEHWTLWSRLEMRHADVQDYVEQWITTNAPHVTAWNYDDNPERSINIFHVHVYLQVGAEGDVLQGRSVHDLVH
ncbi:hypothetical protein SPRG_00627 [Saprolegnia parasitica CBS 223.65]|uniref:Uncharacterized protein n=1 Tax=Saprolegnia parasitica (strain CBS 223.65) TaxID=695850 RepID=A0A067CV31_SAPPC|nr:hypothetical protein SPRG_00627 [Saprolegnia parasitica CBS 223.65]KDO34564.1 hypothetical protein SPRG_00627 [Saprolegnia parasitica CBS 223.65]|eukprot:XP_012194241.1 hypothetical protein SPRG_00627 [Saprolegnia parasitica CBS 223.65]